MIEKLLKEHLSNKYGDFTIIQLTGGYTNETFLLKGTSPPLVVKVGSSSNLDIQNEVNSLRSIEETGIAPKVFDSFKTQHGQITIMEYRQGTNGQSIIDKGDFDKNRELYKLLGRELSANIHSKKYKSNTKGIREFDLEELTLNLDFVPERLIQNSKQLLDTINDQKEKWVLTHGDYGVHNVLFTVENTLTIIDWEWAEWANPLTDIGWVCWFTKLHYPEQADLLNSMFIEEYQKQSPVHLTSEKLKAYCLYKVWKVLDIVRNAAPEVKQEWIRRLKWTLETDLI